MEMFVGIIIGIVMAWAVCKVHYNRRLFNAFNLWIGKEIKLSSNEFDKKWAHFKTETKGLIAIFDEKGKQL